MTSISELSIIQIHPFSPYDEAAIEIQAQFDFFGVRPECLECAKDDEFWKGRDDVWDDCKQYNAREAKIIFCPHMRKEES